MHLGTGLSHEVGEQNSIYAVEGNLFSIKGVQRSRLRRAIYANVETNRRSKMQHPFSEKDVTP